MELSPEEEQRIHDEERAIQDRTNQLARYQILAQRREYQDRLFWSRVQTLHLIQAGVIASSFYIRHEQWNGYPILSICVLFLGIILTTLILIICYYDWKDAEANKASMYKLGDSLGIRWGSERRIRIFGYKIYGHTILYSIFGLFLLVDSGLLLYFILGC